MRVIYQQGYSMIELLVAIALSLIVLAAAVDMQLSHRDSYKAVESRVAMQTDAKVAFDFIGRTIREAGSLGCRTSTQLVGPVSASADYNLSAYKINTPYNGGSPYQTQDADREYDFTAGFEITGFDDTEVEHPSYSFTGNVNPDTDIISVFGGYGQVYRAATIDAGGAYVDIDMTGISQVRMLRNHFAVISDCSRAEVAQIVNNDAEIQSGTLRPLIPFDIQNHATGFVDSAIEIRRLVRSTFFIGNNPLGDPNGVPTLYSHIDGVATPLVEGVEMMQITYGLDTNDLTWNVADEYRTADNISGADWSRVVAVRVAFVMRSKEEVYETAEANPLNLGGVDNYVFTPSAPDKYARLVYYNTITLRNNIIGQRDRQGRS